MEDQRSPESPEPTTPLERHRPHYLRVTDLRDQMWCEKQTEFGLHEGREETEAMRAGSERHQALHAEIAEIIEIQTETREDHWALHLWNALTGLQLIGEIGQGREIPVFGEIAGVWVVGILDELYLTDAGTLQLLDTKTRRSPRLPRQEQKNTTRLQMSLYHRLYQGLARRELKEQDFYAAIGLDPEAELSEELRQEMKDLGFAPKNLAQLLPLTLEMFARMPPLDPQMAVRYEWQQDHSLLGSDEFGYREEWLMQRVRYHLQYWHGERKAVGVNSREGWKCRYCEFHETCSLSPVKRWQESPR